MLSGSAALAAGKKKAAKAAPAAAAAKREAPAVNLNSRPPAGAVEPQADSGGAAPTRGPTRIDFDDRLIKGQTTKTGDVYIYDRQSIDIKSLVNRARSFRARIVRTVFEE